MIDYRKYWDEWKPENRQIEEDKGEKRMKTKGLFRVGFAIGAGVTAGRVITSAILLAVSKQIIKHLENKEQEE